MISCLVEQLASSNEGRYPMSLTEERVYIQFNLFLNSNMPYDLETCNHADP